MRITNIFCPSLCLSFDSMKTILHLEANLTVFFLGNLSGLGPCPSEKASAHRSQRASAQRLWELMICRAVSSEVKTEHAWFMPLPLPQYLHTLGFQKKKKKKEFVPFGISNFSNLLIPQETKIQRISWRSLVSQAKYMTKVFTFENVSSFQFILCELLCHKAEQGQE